MPKTRKIDEIKDGRVVKTYNSIREAAKELNINFRNIAQVLSKRVRTTFGRQFVYTPSEIEGEIWINHPIGIQISNKGRVRYPTGHTSYGTKSFHGYMYCHFKDKKYRIHRLVLESFIGPCPTGYECDHIDRNRTNNIIENLRRVTPTTNQRNRSNTINKTYA